MGTLVTCTHYVTYLRLRCLVIIIFIISSGVASKPHVMGLGKSDGIVSTATLVVATRRLAPGRPQHRTHTQIELPGFRYYSDVSWYRDCAAYCAVADDGERVSAIVAQITTKKPIYKKQLEKLGGELPGAVCAPSIVATQADSGDIYAADVTPDTPGEE